MADTGEHPAIPKAIIPAESSGRYTADSAMAEIARAVAAPSQADTAVQLANLWFGLSELPEGQRIAWHADIAQRVTELGIAVLQQTADERATRLRLVLIGDVGGSADIAHALTLRGDIAALAGCAQASLGATLDVDVSDCDGELATLAIADATRNAYRRAVEALGARGKRRRLPFDAMGIGHLYERSRS